MYERIIPVTAGGGSLASDSAGTPGTATSDTGAVDEGAFPSQGCPRSPSPMQIVIVDDSPVMLAFLKKLVAILPECRPFEFTSAAEALTWCATRDPDLVIVDYLMPELNGLQFAERFRSLEGRAHTPLLMVTATADRELRHHALQLGINDFLNKPFDRIELQVRVRNMLALRASQKKLESRALLLSDEVARATREIAARERETLICIGRAAEHRDSQTHEHVMRVSHYTQLMARRLGLEARECELLMLATPLHDIGKIGIPDHILLKPGYPHGLSGAAIPLYGRIVAVADVFDALTSKRPYKWPWEVDRAFDLIRQESSAHFDPECVIAFCEVFDQVLDIRARYRDAPQAAWADDRNWSHDMNNEG